MKTKEETKVNMRTLGSRKEQVARWFLEQNGYEVLGMNYRCSYGEVDIVCKKDGYIIFVEVKYRTSNKNGFPAQAVDYKKQRKISLVARQYLYSAHLSEAECRFDVVEILGNKIRIIENAFEYKV